MTKVELTCWGSDSLARNSRGKGGVARETSIICIPHDGSGMIGRRIAADDCAFTLYTQYDYCVIHTVNKQII